MLYNAEGLIHFFIYCENTMQLYCENTMQFWISFYKWWNNIGRNDTFEECTLAIQVKETLSKS